MAPDQQGQPSKSSPHALAILYADLALIAAGHNGETHLRPTLLQETLDLPEAGFTAWEQVPAASGRLLPPCTPPILVGVGFLGLATRGRRTVCAASWGMPVAGWARRPRHGLPTKGGPQQPQNVGPKRLRRNARIASAIHGVHEVAGRRWRM